MKKKFPFNLVFALLVFAGCNKKDSPSSKTELLTSGSWKLTAVVSDNDANGTYETNDYASFSDCFKDNFFTFLAGGIAEINEGPVKCSPADPQIETGSWQLTQNETHLKINSDEWILEELTTSTLKWKEEYSGGRSGLVTFTKR